MEMEAREFVKSIVHATRIWRERDIKRLQEMGCSDLSHRPKSGMSAFGWLIGHQGAAYDYILNILIKGGPPKNPDLFYSYRGDSTDNGEWKGTPLDELNDYFDSREKDFLTWFEQASEEELNRIMQGPDVPDYFRGKRVIDVIADMFVHLNFHNGHLSAIIGDWRHKE
ncbi:DinB family protein [Candidatus Thorarchaeota archaeon]|nr:MAG: DinB family protein [Candidatus Thorarchaeota archaeon]